MTPAPLQNLTPPLRWPAELIWQQVEPGLPGFTVEILPEIDSSNSELMRRLRGSPELPARPEPTLLVAEQQSAGRGRLGRSWASRRGDSLTFSLGLPLQPLDWSGLSLVVGISVAESLDAGQHHIVLKWPNDLWLLGPAGESKLGGILVETASWEGQRHVVIGIGINIRPVALSAPAVDAATSPAPLPPGCLQAIYPDSDATSALLQIVPALVQNVQAFEQFGFAPFQARFARRDALAGRQVQLFGQKDGAVSGSAHGVNESGALLVHTASGMKEITSSEVSVRPVSAGQPAC